MMDILRGQWIVLPWVNITQAMDEIHPARIVALTATAFRAWRPGRTKTMRVLREE